MGSEMCIRDSFVIGKKDFEGAKDFRELCTAVMAVRIGDNND